MAFSGLPTDSFQAVTGVLFSLTVDGTDIGYFNKVSGLSIDITPVETTATKDGTSYMKVNVPGRMSYGDIEFGRGLSTDKTLEEWVATVATGKVADARKNGSIDVIDTGTGQPMATFEFQNGWPSRWSGPSLSASADETAIESMTLVVEAITRTA